MKKRKLDATKVGAYALFIVLILLLILPFFMVNPAKASQGWFDFNYKFDEAVVSQLDGTVVRGKLEKWWEYEGSEAIQVQIDGAIYYSHLKNIVLIKNP